MVANVDGSPASSTVQQLADGARRVFDTYQYSREAPTTTLTTWSNRICCLRRFA